LQPPASAPLYTKFDLFPGSYYTSRCDALN
jgi:hypothetical protein